ncbi:hypothetical protein [Sphingomonas jeddahensis]|uniref:Uncharacterized protein n=1 Tax=Sphingomonas jeddahensis TaxID=1915074 RepID=A0A1V2ETA3_9SPHN|nr:hypothetical protein [Sphingomonas jeddahensis]ONF95715.1 hypothetical protein SPHI_21530 [Sphingomonas jeddahensis]
MYRGDALERLNHVGTAIVCRASSAGETRLQLSTIDNARILHSAGIWSDKKSVDQHSLAQLPVFGHRAALP